MNGESLRPQQHGGNGIVGEDVTDNIVTLREVPRTLTRKIDIIVEGEVYLTTKELERINRARKKDGLEEYCQPAQLGCRFTAAT